MTPQATALWRIHILPGTKLGSELTLTGSCHYAAGGGSGGRRCFGVQQMNPSSRPHKFILRPHSLPSHGGGVAVYVLDLNQPSLLTPFYSVLVSVSVSMPLSTISFQFP